MNKKEVSKYLAYLKINKKFKYKDINCDVCGSSKRKILKKKISWNNNRFGVLPVVCCLNCGFLYQNPRFEKNFYDRFYSEFYRKVMYSDVKPSKRFLKDQLSRGNKIFKFLKKNISMKKGKMLDVGCSSGLMLMPFLKDGWKAEGYDPEKFYVEYGKSKYNLPIEVKRCEDMKLKRKSFDLILIAGSLEHCYDPNKILKICAKASKKNSILVLEGRGYPRSTSKHYFNHNHHRYFTLNSFELMMIKHGWKPILSTLYPISGPTREGTNWVIGTFQGVNKNIKKKLNYLIKNGKNESYETMKHYFLFYDVINKDINPNLDYISKGVYKKK